jgi:hypothetical protein
VFSSWHDYHPTNAQPKYRGKVVRLGRRLPRSSVRGPVLTGFTKRTQALAAEVAWLEENVR